MPSFTFHMYASSAVGIAGMAYGLTYLDWNPATAVLGGGAGVVGGMIPDLDSDTGRPVRIVSGLVSLILIAGVVQYALALGWPPTHVALLGGAALLFFNIFGVMAFKSLTRHRGMFHSIPAVIAYGAALAVGFGSLGRDIALPMAVIGLGGGLSHLLLDALFSLSLDPLKLKNKDQGATLFAWTLCLLFLGLAFIGPRGSCLSSFHSFLGDWLKMGR
jgi:membrane-bound metal-dependent hydrolase YbcI (DUF457 family)